MSSHEWYEDLPSSTPLDENLRRLDSQKVKLEGGLRQSPRVASYGAGAFQSDTKTKETTAKHGHSTTGVVVKRPVTQFEGDTKLPHQVPDPESGGFTEKEKGKLERGTSLIPEHHLVRGSSDPDADIASFSPRKRKGGFGMEREKDLQKTGTGFGDDGSVGSVSTYSKGKDAARGGGGGDGQYTMWRRPLGDSPCSPSSGLVSMHEERQKQKQKRYSHLDSTKDLTQRSTGATLPLVSLMHEFELNDYQRALYEQKHGSRSSSPTRSLPSLYSGETLEAVAMSSIAGGECQAKSTASAVSLQCEEIPEDLPELIEGKALAGLSRDELVGQCSVRDLLIRQSELHEMQIGETLTETEDKLHAVEEENQRLKEENWQLKLDGLSRVGMSESSTGTEDRSQSLEVEKRRLEEENRWLKLKVKSRSPERSRKQSGDDLPAVDMLRLVTILFTCQVKDFNIVKVIAHGCEGAVFLVKCNKESPLLAGKVFAMKVMFNVFGHATFTQVRSYYQSEYNTLCSMTPHPNIMRLFAFFYDRLSGVSEHDLPEIVKENAHTFSLFLIMEHIPQTLEKHVDNLRKLGELKAHSIMGWILQVFKGIRHLLNHRIVHRDLKLNNVLFSHDKVVKLCDFGCSIQLLEDMTIFYGPGTSLGGNPAHMPPELLNTEAGRKISCVTQDLWAAGVMIYEMASDISPFAGLDQKGYRMRDLPPLAIKNEKTKTSMAIPVDVEFPQPFIKLVLSLLEYDPAKRPDVQSAITSLEQQLGQMD